MIELQDMAFAVMTERSAQEMAEYLRATKIRWFFKVDISWMLNLVECEIAAARASIEPEGIRYDNVGHLVTNAQIVATLQLKDSSILY